MNHRKLAIGAMFGVAVNFIKTVGLLLLLPIMAKLVGPTDYGLYSIALPAVMFVMVISDAGLGMSLSRESDDESAVWPSAYLLLMAMAIGLSALLILYAWIVSGSLEDKRLVPVTATLACSLLFSAISVVPAARLVRNSDIQFLALTDLIGFAVSVSIALSMAAMHFGVWSLVAQQVSASLCRALILNLRARPSIRLKFEFASLRSHLTLGGSVGLGRLSDFGGRMFEMFILTRTSGSLYNGPFGFGNQVGKFACESVNNQIWGLMYIMGLHSPLPELKASYFRLTRVIGMLVLPISILVSVSCADLVRLTMGPEWAKSTLLIAVFTPAFAITCIASIGSSLMYARGIARDPLAINIELVVLRVLAVSLMYVSSWETMIYALGGAHILNAAHAFWIIERRFKWNIGAVLLWLLRPLFASILAAGLYVLLLRYIPVNLPTVIGAGLASVLFYLAVLTAMDFHRITSDIGAFYMLLRGVKAAAPSQS